MVETGEGEQLEGEEVSSQKTSFQKLSDICAQREKSENRLVTRERESRGPKRTSDPQRAVELVNTFRLDQHSRSLVEVRKAGSHSPVAWIAAKEFPLRSREQTEDLRKGGIPSVTSTWGMCEFEIGFHSKKVYKSQAKNRGGGGVIVGSSVGLVLRVGGLKMKNQNGITKKRGKTGLPSGRRACLRVVCQGRIGGRRDLNREKRRKIKEYRP